MTNFNHIKNFVETHIDKFRASGHITVTRSNQYHFELPDHFFTITFQMTEDNFDFLKSILVISEGVPTKYGMTYNFSPKPTTKKTDDKEKSDKKK